MWPLYGVVIAAVTDWLGIATHRRGLEYVGKPAVMVFLIAWLLVGVPRSAWMQPAAWCFLAGLAWSLVGDILLMLPSGRFLPGLAMFLLAHVGYLTAFNFERPALQASDLWLALPIIAGMAPLFLWSRKRLHATQRGKYFGPLVVYTIVLCMTLWTTVGVLFRSSWAAGGAAWIAFGGTAFFLSDLSLAWNRFITPLPGGRLATHVSYHLAQTALTGGVVLAYSLG